MSVDGVIEKHAGKTPFSGNEFDVLLQEYSLKRQPLSLYIQFCQIRLLLNVGPEKTCFGQVFKIWAALHKI